MTTKLGFTKMTIQEFATWIKSIHIARTITTIQQHHTYIPSYTEFRGTNHFEMQQGMKNHHINSNGWSDIGQQFSTFPDGSILTGRSLEKSPACIYGQNANAICIEHVGNFDLSGDTMTPAHRDTIIQITAILCTRFNLAVDTNRIVYHHWFNLETGARNNGTGKNKTCPGTNFFGGNKVAHCEANFLPLVAQQISGQPVVPNPAPAITNPIKYACVNTASLNVRIAANASASKADHAPVTLGAILRVFAEQNGWYKISSGKDYWVSATYTYEVKRAIVNANSLNIRTGPAATFAKVGSYTKGQELFIEKEQNNWCKINMETKWMSKDYLVF